MDFFIFLIFVFIFFGKPISKALKKAAETQKDMSSTSANSPWEYNDGGSDTDDVLDVLYENTHTETALKKQIASIAARTQAGAENWNDSWGADFKNNKADTQASLKVKMNGQRPVLQDMNRQRVKGLSRYKRDSIFNGPEFFAVLTLIALAFYLFTLIGS